MLSLNVTPQTIYNALHKGSTHNVIILRQFLINQIIWKELPRNDQQTAKTIQAFINLSLA